ncbi:MAG: winged helix-turn-helix transcriptional regulator [Nitrososphaerota archaeon]|nr:winged helix-turn-helix transcriptional regulator [Nitrososphaerota archaeon]
MNVVQSKSVQRLIQLGVCQPSDIKRAMIEAEKLSTPENSLKIRKIERTFGLLGDSNRIKILFLLSKREMCVCEIEAALKLPQPTVSHHLGLLEQSDLLQRSKRGKWVFYKVNETPLVQLVQKMIEAD